MFKISTPQAALPSTSYNGYGEASTSRAGALMEVDEEDPTMTAGAGHRIAIPGEAIASATEWMRGHGTYVQDDTVLASVAGTVERVNKLVSVRALRSKYRPEVGDLVIGRITEVGPRRWRVDANGRLDAILMLSSINLPGGVQRRKLESDELQMRTFFQEGDLLVAEVQALMSEGTMSLHTRSLKYGKLRNGVLVSVPPSLVTRLKSHFHALECGVDMILGMNGYVWVQAPSKTEHHEDPTSMMDERGESSASMAIYSSQNDAIDPKTKNAIDRVAMCIRILASHWVPITDEKVSSAYIASREIRTEDGQAVETDELLRPDVAESILAAVAE